MRVYITSRWRHDVRRLLRLAKYFQSAVRVFPLCQEPPTGREVSEARNASQAALSRHAANDVFCHLIAAAAAASGGAPCQRASRVCFWLGRHTAQHVAQQLLPCVRSSEDHHGRRADRRHNSGLQQRTVMEPGARGRQRLVRPYDVWVAGDPWQAAAQWLHRVGERVQVAQGAQCDG